MVVTYIAGITAICLLSGPLKSVLVGKRKSWYLYVTLPLSCIILVTDLANWAASNGILVQDRGKYGLFENQLFSHGAMCIFTGLAMGAAGFMVFGLNRIEEEERAGEHYRCQVAYYEMMEEQYSRMEHLRHDMKNHIIALSHLVQNRQWEKAVAYLREMAELGGVEAGDEITGSLAVDALLYHKRLEAAERGILWECDAKLPADCPVREMDLCIIVGNALDNALAACGRLSKKDKPVIRIYLGPVRKCLLLEVRNPMDQEEKPKGPGLGLENIQAAAAIYNGAVCGEAENGVFTLTVLLPYMT